MISFAMDILLLVMICFEGLVVTHTVAGADASENGENMFLPYGVDEGDTNATLSGSDVLGPIHLNSPIILYNKQMKSLYISSDVLISSDERLTRIHTHHFVHFPRFHGPDIPLVAPLWASFRSVPVHYRVATDMHTLQLVTDMIINGNSNLTGYQPDLAFILTVENGILSFDATKMVKFQVVLATDGKASFAAFIYEDPQFLSSIPGDFQIGFDAGDIVRGLVLLGTAAEYSNNSLQHVNIYRIDGICVTGIAEDQVCRLNSQSTGCSNESILATSSCVCNPGVTATNCEGSSVVTYNCPVNSTYLRCSETFPICLISNYVCDKIADCADAVDEVPEQCGHDFSLLPFGPGINDDENDINSLTHYLVGDTRVPIVFYRQNLTNIHASSNGLITFNYGFAESQVHGLPRTIFPVVPLITPLWTAFIDQELGILFRRITYDAIHLAWAKDMLLEYNIELDSFEPLVAVIVTWLDFDLPTSTPQSVTHQAVLISDGNVSFAAFVYDNSTVGIATAFKGNKLAGFDAGDGIRSATIHNPSPDLSSLQQLETVNIFRIDGHCITLAEPDYMCDLNSYAVSCNADLSAKKCRCFDSTDTAACEVDAPYTCEAGSIPSVCQDHENPELTECFPERLVCNLNAECSQAEDEMNCTQTNGFLLFGVGAGDTRTERQGDEINAASITLPAATPIKYYGQRETQIYASSNGLVSFREQFTSSDTASFPRRSLPVPLIAPLWAEYIPSLSGPMYHRVAEDTPTLQRVAEMITDYNPLLSGYSPSVAVIVSWFEIRLMDDSSDGSNIHNSNEVTFQLVLSSDGNASFAALTYKDPRAMKSLNEPVQVGFDAGDKTRGVNISPLSSAAPLQQVNVFRIDGSCISKASPGYVCGLPASTTECDESALSATTCVCENGKPYQGMGCEGGKAKSRAVGGIIGGLSVFALLLAGAIVVLFLFMLLRKQRGGGMKGSRHYQDFQENGLSVDEKSAITL